ncbi:MAG TPA: RICIN domain-containing protein [Trebonia sp.]|nr:RICIN domain-containing protein [Trebonia sp.]
MLVENLRSKYCLHVVYASKSSGAAIQQDSCGLDNDAILFRVRASVTLHGDVYHQYQNVGSGLCLEPTGASEQADAQVVQEKCASTSDYAQFWRTDYTSGSHYELRNGHSGLCMSIAGASTAVNANVLQGTCIGAPSQTWVTAVSSQ